MSEDIRSSVPTLLAAGTLALLITVPLAAVKEDRNEQPAQRRQRVQGHLP